MSVSRHCRWVAGLISSLIALLASTESARADCRPDWNASGSLSVQDIFDFLTDWFGGNGDYNGIGGTTVQDIFDFLEDWFEGCNFGPVITAAPSSGQLGTPVTLTISDALAPYVFSTSSTIVWAGRYVGANGMSGFFQVDFGTSEVIELSASQALIVVGTGSGALPAGVELFGQGRFEGTLSVPFANGATSSTPFNFTPSGSAPSWKRIQYPDGIGGLASPTLSGVLSSLPMYAMSISPDPQSPTDSEMTYAAIDSHIVVEFYVVSNSYSDLITQPTRIATLVSYDQEGNEIARVPNVQFMRSSSPVGGLWVYRSLVTKPIVLVDVTFTVYPNLAGTTVVPAAAGGKIFVIP